MIQGWWKNLRDQFFDKLKLKSGAEAMGQTVQVEQWRFWNAMSFIKKYRYQRVYVIIIY